MGSNKTCFTNFLTLLNCEWLKMFHFSAEWGKNLYVSNTYLNQTCFLHRWSETKSHPITKPLKQQKISREKHDLNSYCLLRLTVIVLWDINSLLPNEKTSYWLCRDQNRHLLWFINFWTVTEFQFDISPMDAIELFFVVVGYTLFGF